MVSVINNWVSLPPGGGHDRDRTEWLRLEQEERYRRELARRQILQRQWDMAQAAQQFPFCYQDSMWGQQQSYTRSNSSFAPSLVRRTTSNPVISTSHGVGSTWPQQSSKFGSPPTVRNPSTMSRTDISKPLSVDVSVEYELPEALKVSTKENGPSLLMIRNRSTKKQCLVTGCSKCVKQDQQKRVVVSGAMAMPASTAGRVTEAVTKGVAGNVSGEFIAKNQCQYLPSANRGQSVVRNMLQNSQMFPQDPPKTTLKRKLTELQNDEFIYKRQKMTLLTPPDIMSASYFMETPRNIFQTPLVPEPLSARFQKSPTMFQRSPTMFQKSPSMYPSSTQLFQRSPGYHEKLYPVSCSLYPVREHPGFTSMYPQYRHSLTCTGCAQGLCQTMR